ncbi:MAG: hypothetical protein HYV63_08120 [Candidatus Schekmanbacteria bacterium]|nr:hypothetical protein [Candidatus Schekmanbacteria bacterium]
MELTEIASGLSLIKDLPLSARYNMRIVDKRTSNNRTGDLGPKDRQLKLRAMHEVEVFLAGRAGKYLSFFGELEAEDEWPDPNGDGPGFQVQFAMGTAQLNLHEALRVSLGFGPIFWADGYNTLRHENFTRMDWAATEQGFVPGDGQFVGVSGRPMDRLFYNVVFSGDDGDLEGHDARSLHGRIAFDVMAAKSANLMVGTFYSASRLYDSSSGTSHDKLNRLGVDLQLETHGLGLNAIYAQKELEPADGKSVKDDDISLELSYLLSKNNRPVFGPALIIDKYTQKDGEDDWTKLGLFVNYFALENLRLALGWEGTVSAPDAFQHKESRLTLVLDMGL